MGFSFYDKGVTKIGPNMGASMPVAQDKRNPNAPTPPPPPSGGFSKYGQDPSGGGVQGGGSAPATQGPRPQRSPTPPSSAATASPNFSAMANQKPLMEQAASAMQQKPSIPQNSVMRASPAASSTPSPNVASAAQAMLAPKDISSIRSMRGANAPLAGSGISGMNLTPSAQKMALSSGGGTESVSSPLESAGEKLARIAGLSQRASAPFITDNGEGGQSVVRQASPVTGPGTAQYCGADAYVTSNGQMVPGEPTSTMQIDTVGPNLNAPVNLNPIIDPNQETNISTIFDNADAQDMTKGVIPDMFNATSDAAFDEMKASEMSRLASEGQRNVASLLRQQAATGGGGGGDEMAGMANTLGATQAAQGLASAAIEKSRIEEKQARLQSAIQYAVSIGDQELEAKTRAEAAATDREKAAVDEQTNQVQMRNEIANQANAMVSQIEDLFNMGAINENDRANMSNALNRVYAALAQGGDIGLIQQYLYEAMQLIGPSFTATSGEPGVPT